MKVLGLVKNTENYYKPESMECNETEKIFQNQNILDTIKSPRLL